MHFLLNKGYFILAYSYYLKLPQHSVLGIYSTIGYSRSGYSIVGNSVDRYTIAI